MTTLGALVTRLEEVSDDGLPVVFGGDIYKAYASMLPASGGVLVPSHYCSYRGFYDRACLVPEYGRRDVTVEALTMYTNNAIGETFRGWKGGDYTMHENTPVHIAIEGETTDLGLFDVVETAERVILVTYFFGHY